MKRSATKAEPITPAEYRAFQEAFDFFNADLFAGSLPHVLVTLQGRGSLVTLLESFAWPTGILLNATR